LKDYKEQTSARSVEVGVEAPDPHSKKQALIMSAFQIPGLMKIYVACGTKYGKSLSASACLSQAAVKRRGTKWRWLAPVYEQSKVGMDYFRKMLPPDPHSQFKDNAMRVHLPYLDTEIQFWHCKNAVSLEGPSIHGNIFDEAAKCPYDAVASAQTTVTLTKGPQGYFSTPFGKNWFYRECMEAREHMAWALKRGKQPERIFLTAPTTDNPFVDKKVVLEARRSLPDRLFRQYYLAEFVDDGSVFIGFKSCVRGEEIDVDGAVQSWVHPKADACEVFIGADWAKKEDFVVFSAFTVIEGLPRMVGFMRFNGVGYVDALKELYRFSKKFKNVIVIKHDQTGVGEAIDDMLVQLGIPFEGVVFTSISKAAMVNKLMLGCESQGLVLCNWPELIHEFEVYTVVVNELGNSRYSAPAGMHDDIVSSVMLGYFAACEYTSEFKLRFMEDLPSDKLTVDKWYGDLVSEYDN